MAKQRRDLLAEVKDELTRVAYGRYAPKGIDWCCDRLSWMYTFNKAPRDQILELVEMATAIMDGTYVEEEYKCTL